MCTCMLSQHSPARQGGEHHGRIQRHPGRAGHLAQQDEPAMPARCRLLHLTTGRGQGSGPSCGTSSWRHSKDTCGRIGAPCIERRWASGGPVGPRSCPGALVPPHRRATARPAGVPTGRKGGPFPPGSGWHGGGRELRVKLQQHAWASRHGDAPGCHALPAHGGCRASSPPGHTWPQAAPTAPWGWHMAGPEWAPQGADLGPGSLSGWGVWGGCFWVGGQQGKGLINPTRPGRG